MRSRQNPFVDEGLASEISVLEKEYGKGIVGDDQLEMTRFQKQVLLREEQRQSEQAKQNSGGSGHGTLNAKHSRGRSETTRYKNENKMEAENQVEFVD